jgi:hypothetical protein
MTDDKLKPKQYRKKPVVVEAIQWTGANLLDVADFTGTANFVVADPDTNGRGWMVYNKLERQWLNCPVGHWIIKGVKNEFYPCEPGVFDTTYEPADTPRAPSEALRLAKESMESEEFAIMLGDYLNSLVALREPVTPQDFIKMAKRVMENVIVPRLAAIEKEGV